MVVLPRSAPMERHHLQMIVVFAAALVAVLWLGPLWGMCVGISVAAALAPWSNPGLRRWLWLHMGGAIFDDGHHTPFANTKHEAKWLPVEHAVLQAMEEEGLHVTADNGTRDLNDQDIRKLIELEKAAHRAEVSFEVLDGGTGEDESNIDIALRRRQRKLIRLPSSY